MDNNAAIAELERRRHAAGVKLARAAHAGGDEARADVELHADAIAHYGQVIEALRRTSTGTYVDGGPHSLFVDLVSNNAEASERLRAHREEHRAGGTTGDYGGLVVPQYLTDRTVAYGRSSRPLCDYLAEPLPGGGMSVSFPRVTASETAEHQDPENTTATLSDIATEPLTFPLSTAVAGTTLSFQASSRMPAHAFERTVGGELIRAVGALQEAAVINGNGTAGAPTGLLQETGIGTVTLTSTAVVDVLDAISEAAAATEAARGVAADTVVLSPRRWRWLLTAGGDRSAAIAATTAAGPVVGQLVGMNAIASQAVPTTLGTSTNEDRIIVTRRSDLYLAEEPPVVRKQKDTANGGSDLRERVMVDRHYVFGVLSPDAVQVIAGAGLVNPFA